MEIAGTHQELLGFMQLLKDRKMKKFVYNKSKSDDYADMIFAKRGEAACFLTRNKALFNSSIWMALSQRKIRIFNIVPGTKSQLSLDEYNAVLEEFFESLTSTYPEYETRIVMSPSRVSIEDMMPEAAYKSLHIWESNCNRDGGIAHPFDYERWLQFIIVSHKCASQLKREMLEKWLLEDKHWGELRADCVRRLGSLYEYGMELLKEADKHGI